MGNLKIGIIVADVEEYRLLEMTLSKYDHKPYDFISGKGDEFMIKTENGVADTVSVLSNIGKTNAAASAMHLCDIGCDIIINFGLSGGISGVNRGELSLCTGFVEHDFDMTCIGYKPYEKPAQKYIYEINPVILEFVKKSLPDIKCGFAASGDCFVSDENLRNKLKEDFNAMSCDMETAAIASVCYFAKIPCICIRRISDDAGSDACGTYREMNTSDETILSDSVMKLCEDIIDSNLLGKLNGK